MSEFSPEEAEKRKRAVFESMSPRRQKHILKKGYDKWDPFEEPKDPIDIKIKPNGPPRCSSESFCNRVAQKITAMLTDAVFLKWPSELSTTTSILKGCSNLAAGTASFWKKKGKSDFGSRIWDCQNLFLRSEFSPHY
jgi:hypothetical protein